MKTEAEAKKCWCPFARVPVDHGMTGNRIDRTDADGGPLPNRGANCIASECMAWRWAYRFVHVETGEGTHFEPKHGYCGLAGKP